METDSSPKKFRENTAEKEEIFLEGRQEIVIGLVAKIGTDVEAVQSCLSSELDEYGYDTILIKVSKLVNHPKVSDLGLTEIDDQYFESYCSTAMDACNELRSKCGNSIMAELSVDFIRSLREKHSKDRPGRPRAFVIRQLKRKEEVDFLRNLYGDRFVLISTYCPSSIRKEKLSSQIATSHHSYNSKDYYSEAESLIKRDENEVEAHSGQNVRDVFPLADVILDGKTEQLIQKTVRRFLLAFFGCPTSSPSNDEYGAHTAFSASLRSIDLSRKVGVAIFSEKLEVLAMGCNEVPKYGGGTYLHDEVDASDKDGRDAARGFDANARMKALMAMDAATATFNFVSEVLDLSNSDRKSLEDALGSKPMSEHSSLNKMLVLDIGEFGRAVHAEMNAITDAARSNHSLKDATLYSTTFPCHNCAKHIVAAGIKKVIYLQPYPKSRVNQLYPDSIEINPIQEVDQKVTFEVLTGIAPNAFARIYGDTRKRKNPNGDVVKWRKSSAIPIISSRQQSYINDEAFAVKIAMRKLDRIKT